MHTRNANISGDFTHHAGVFIITPNPTHRYGWRCGFPRRASQGNKRGPKQKLSPPNWMATNAYLPDDEHTLDRLSLMLRRYSDGLIR